MIMRLKPYIINSLLALSFLVGLSCSSQKEKEHISFQKREVGDVYVFLRADSSNAISIPSWIKPVRGGFLLYDDGLHKISRFDLEGHKLLSFGREGRGPGEYQSVGGFWRFGDEYLVYDINSRKLIRYDNKGNLIKDIPLGFVAFPPTPAGIEAVSPVQFVMPSGGKKGALLTLVNIASKSIRYVGKAVGKEYALNPSSDELRRAISAGNIPDMYKNNILLSSNRTGFFCFQQTTGLLEKYTYSGKLLWQKNVKVPAVEGLFKQLFEENRDRIAHGKFLLSFNFANGLSATHKGVGILLNTPDNQPITIAWVPNNGGNITVVTFPELSRPDRLPFRFAISDDGACIFFVSTLEGKIYKAAWPL